MLSLKKLLIAIGVTVFCVPSMAMAADDHSAEEKHEKELVSQYYSVTNPFSGVIIEYDLQKSDDDDLHFQIRFKDKGKDTEWVDIEADIDGDVKGQRVDSLVNTNETTQYQYRVISTAGADSIKPKISNVKFKFINPKGEESIVASIRSMASLVSLSSNSLRVVSRREWGSNEDYTYAEDSGTSTSSGDKSSIQDDDPEILAVVREENGRNLKWPIQYMKEVRMIVVHHTASTSELNNPKQAIRNIQYYHAVSRGWGDIGYNYIIDQQGNIYEGRKGGLGVVGGHAIPVNKTSVGISVLGNFETQKVPKAVVDSIALLSKEIADSYDLDVTDTVSYKGKTYPVLGGHRDNSATACPGRNLYNVIPLIRNLADSGDTLDSQEDSLASRDFAYIDEDPLRDVLELKANESTQIEIELKNVGKKSWSKSSTYLQNLNESEYSNGLVTARNKIATLKESTVNPGRTGTFVIDVAALARSGAYSIMAQGVLNGETRYSTPIFIPVTVKGVSTVAPVQVTGYEYEIVGNNSLDLELDKNETRQITVTFKNTGEQTWNENFKYLKLGVFSPKDGKSKLFNGATRVAEFGTEEVDPNKSIKITLNLKAPNEDVTITESYAPVIDGLTWLDKGTPLKITAKVGKGTVEQNIDLQTDNFNSGDLGPNIRINISNFKLGEAEVSASESTNLVIDGKSVKSVSKNQKVNFIKSGTQITAKVDGNEFTGKVARLVPASGTNNIFTVHNYENRPAWNTDLNDNQFRGTAEFTVIDSEFKFINELPIEHYMRGVAEISNNTGSEKIKTILVAARSYAYYHVAQAPDRKFPGKGYNLDDSPDRSQKYLGYGFEKRSPNVVKALTETNGKVITYNNKLIVVPYFNQSDGRTRSAKEVWGWTDTPYLISVEDKDCATATELLGHGVGISGCGATGMADKGKSHEEIIKYYLQGVDFKIAYGKNANGPIFPDVTTATEYSEAIRFMKNNGIIEGYPDGTFKPRNQINRAEFVKIMVEAKFNNITDSSSCFPDVPTGEWFTKYVCLAKKEGIIEGHPDGTFKPADNINVAEALKIVLETFYNDIPNASGEWYAKYKSFAERNGLFFGRDWANLSFKTMRGEMAELIYRIKTK